MVLFPYRHYGLLLWTLGVNCPKVGIFVFKFYTAFSYYLCESSFELNSYTFNYAFLTTHGQSMPTVPSDQLLHLTGFQDSFL